MNRAMISVVIPTYKPDQRFRELLRRLRAQTLPPAEILVVNTQESLFDQELIRDIDGIRLVHIQKEDFDHGGTRDMAVSLTEGDIIVFMTMDALPADRHLLEKLVEPFADPRVACSYARQIPDKDADALERYSRMFNYGDQDMVKTKADLPRLGIKTYFCSNACAAYRRSTYQQVGGFITRTIFNEDMIFAAEAVEAGYAVAYASKARVIHSHHYTGSQQLHRNFDLGVSQAEHPEIFDQVKSESEGIKMVKQQAAYLVKCKKAGKIPHLLYISGCKYIGYRLGKAYQKLPGFMVKKLSMNRSYWE